MSADSWEVGGRAPRSVMLDGASCSEAVSLQVLSGLSRDNLFTGATACVPCTEDSAEPVASHGRPKRIPGQQVLQNARFQWFLEELRSSSTAIGQANGRVLRLKQYVSADARPHVIDAVLDALEENSSVEALYIQNFEKGMHDSQLKHLTCILEQKRIWALNVGENFEISIGAWAEFTSQLRNTAVAYLYVSEHHLIRTNLKVKMRDAIRDNRRAAPPRDPRVIMLIGNMWYNPKLPCDYDPRAVAEQQRGLEQHGHLLRARPRRQDASQPVQKKGQGREGTVALRRRDLRRPKPMRRKDDAVVPSRIQPTLSKRKCDLVGACQGRARSPKGITACRTDHVVIDNTTSARTGPKAALGVTQAGELRSQHARSGQRFRSGEQEGVPDVQKLVSNSKRIAAGDCEKDVTEAKSQEMGQLAACHFTHGTRHTANAQCQDMEAETHAEGPDSNGGLLLHVGVSSHSSPHPDCGPQFSAIVAAGEHHPGRRRRVPTAKYIEGKESEALLTQSLRRCAGLGSSATRVHTVPYVVPSPPRWQTTKPRSRRRRAAIMETSGTPVTGVL
mmetsp:Transcript_18336/g.51364  ORF Transcript_18336/g.51364 Transcript_18336/m.51364 type:complete len:560 (-) Transcript_18336:2509-4188(-)